MFENKKSCRKCGRILVPGISAIGSKCAGCYEKGRNKWRLGVILSLLLSFTSLIGLNEMRISQEKRIEAESIARDNAIIDATIEQLERLWNGIGLLQEQIDGLGEIANRHRADLTTLTKQLEDLKKALFANNAEAGNLNAIQTFQLEQIEKQVKELAAEVVAMRRIPLDRLQAEMLSPTVRLFVREAKQKHADQLRGSGILFKKQKLERGYRYWVATDYHLFDDVLEYLEQRRPHLPEEEKLTPEFWVTIWRDDGVSARYSIQCNLLFPNTHIKNANASSDFCVLTFDANLDLPVAEFATDAEIDTLKVSDEVWNSAVFPAEKPTLVRGMISAIGSPVYGKTIACQLMAQPGMSGSAVFADFNGKLKVIAFVQVMSVSGVGGNSVMAFCGDLRNIRRIWKLKAPDELKGILE